MNTDQSAAGATGGNAWNLYIEPGVEFNLAFVSGLFNPDAAPLLTYNTGLYVPHYRVLQIGSG